MQLNTWRKTQFLNSRIFFSFEKWPAKHSETELFKIMCQPWCAEKYEAMTSAGPCPLPFLDDQAVKYKASTCGAKLTQSLEQNKDGHRELHF